MKMTDYQRELVTQHMNLVDCVIRTGIHISNNTLETYEDYYQIGCEALCKAAMSYRPSVSTFQTYASRVIRNALIDHGRAMFTRQKQNSGIDLEEWLQGNEYGCEIVDDHGFQNIFDKEALAALDSCSRNYTGVVKKGADAIRLKALGYSTREIAEMYQTSRNNVAAWISKARAKLEKNNMIRNLAEIY